MTNHPPSYYLDIGALGEDLVAKWLTECGWNILHRRWRCRLGEIDIIAESGIEKKGEKGSSHISPTPYSPLSTPTLAFIEVKTRSTESWDAGGRDAVALRKQQKLWRTAQVFLTKYPQKADYSCRFDVAIVFSQEMSKKVKVSQPSQSLAVITVPGYNLTLQEYIPAAFDSL
jgi:putative endonuclease